MTDLKYKVFHSPKQIKDFWLKLQTNNPNIDPFVKYDFHKYVYDTFWVFKILRRCNLLYIYSYDINNEPAAIIPIVKYRNNRYELFMNINGLSYSSILYSDGEKVKKLFKQLRNDNINLSAFRVKEKSPIYSSLSKETDKYYLGSNNNVAIDFASYSEWFNSLSKSVRQNVRTAYNRLSKNGLNYTLIVVKGDSESVVSYSDSQYGNPIISDINKKVAFKQMMHLYDKRHKTRYNLNTNFIKRYILNHLHFITRNIKYSSDGLSFILLINGKIAAFSQGFADSNVHEYIVPRLSINDTFKFYSPGYILVNELIKYFDKNTDIRRIDLAKGREKYKFDLGGQVHKSYNFILK